jgi:murein DD-endopeptidase MepM/ murein hydrolase activator NlpD
VNRRLSAVSSSEIQLRNPDNIFTHPDSDGTVAFNPMDPVTIYLKRVRGRPVRVFTGFLDKVPFIQLFPGTITLRASCTLKKLLYTYFDPALPYTQSFLAAYGWFPDPQNPGAWFSNMGLNDFRKGQQETDKEYLKLTGQSLATANDGSIGELLFATLKFIARWPEDSIFIETLPNGLFKHLTELAQEFEKDNVEAKKELEELLRRIVGEGGFGNGVDSGVDLSGIDGSVAQQVYEVGKRMGVSYKFMLAAFMTGIVETHFQNLPGGDADSAGWRQERKSLYPDPTNVPHSAKRFFEECASLDHGQTAGELAADVQRPAQQYRGRYEEERVKAVALIRKIKAQVDGRDSTTPTANQGQGGAARDASTADVDKTTRAKRRDGRTDKSSSDNLKIWAPVPAGGTDRSAISSPYGEQNHGNPPHTHMGIDIPCPAGSDCVAPADGKIGKFAQTSGFGGAGGMIHFVFDKDVGDIKAGTVIGWGHVRQVLKKPGDAVKAGEVIAKSNHYAPHVHFIQRSDSNDMDGTQDPTGLFLALQKGDTTPTSGGGGRGIHIGQWRRYGP